MYHTCCIAISSEYTSTHAASRFTLILWIIFMWDIQMILVTAGLCNSLWPNLFIHSGMEDSWMVVCLTASCMGSPCQIAGIFGFRCYGRWRLPPKILFLTADLIGNAQRTTSLLHSLKMCTVAKAVYTRITGKFFFNKIRTIIPSPFSINWINFNFSIWILLFL